ncbi:MAG: selenide, water dikinase SelD [Chitinophagaceae bacterium]|nr:selenide, water dikinase SelD [Chitinophagaceae bacterium]
MKTAESDATIYRLTEYSHGAGCGCKISPKVLKDILSESFSYPDGNLIVGNSDSDDAAVYDLQNGNALISTTDFFTPIVDDAFAFGKIAAANAISDIYAMGGTPLLSVAILGWPEKIPSSEAKKVMAGAREICAQAKISMAGGHSIESVEPFFGLAVNGLVALENLKRNNTAKAGDLIFITQPVGIGILATAQKRKVIADEDVPILMSELSKLNSIGERVGKIKEASAMTDITGFGLAGHLLEIAEGSGLSAVLDYAKIPVYERARHYLKDKVMPDATYRNWNNLDKKIEIAPTVDFMEAFGLLPDPQTNGGLMIAIAPEGEDKLIELFRQNGLGDFVHPIGRFTEKQEKTILVQ